MKTPIGRFLPLVLCLVGSTAAAQAAQTAPQVRSPDGRPFVLGALPFVPGTPIRIRIADGRLVEGQLVSSGDDTIRVTNDIAGRVALATDTIAALDYKLGARERRNHTFRGIGIGAAAGGLIGGVIGAAMPVHKPCSPGESLCMDFSGLDRMANAGGGLLLGLVVGSVAGGLLGHADGKQWKPYAVGHINFAPGRVSGSIGRVSLTLSMR
jgi:hypothetical protein